MSCDYSDQFSARKRLSIFEQLLRPIGQNQITMNTPKLFTIAAVSAGLALGVVTQAKEKEEEQSISSSDVPAAVQQAAFAGKKRERTMRLSSKKVANSGASKSTRMEKS